jgi:hypothetical protein
MNIVDSSLWVEYFLENDIDQSIIDTIKDAGNLYIPDTLPMASQTAAAVCASIIYATAVLWDAELYTQDKHFENLDRVHYFSK